MEKKENNIEKIKEKKHYLFFMIIFIYAVLILPLAVLLSGNIKNNTLLSILSFMSFFIVFVFLLYLMFILKATIFSSAKKLLLLPVIFILCFFIISYFSKRTLDHLIEFAVPIFIICVSMFLLLLGIVKKQKNKVVFVILIMFIFIGMWILYPVFIYKKDFDKYCHEEWDGLYTCECESGFSCDDGMNRENIEKYCELLGLKVGYGQISIDCYDLKYEEKMRQIYEEWL